MQVGDGTMTYGDGRVFVGSVIATDDVRDRVSIP